jgi:hypothetical protein
MAWESRNHINLYGLVTPMQLNPTIFHRDRVVGHVSGHHDPEAPAPGGHWGLRVRVPSYKVFAELRALCCDPLLVDSPTGSCFGRVESLIRSQDLSMARDPRPGG